MTHTKTEFMKKVLAGIGVCTILIVVLMLFIGVSKGSEDQSALVLQGTQSGIKSPSTSPSTGTVASSPNEDYQCGEVGIFGGSKDKIDYGLNIAIDGSNNLFVSDLGIGVGMKVTKITPGGNFSKFASGYQPGDIVINSSGIYVTDYGGKIYKYDKDGKVLNTWTYYLNPNKKPDPKKGIAGPSIMAFDPISKNFYVVEHNQSVGFNIVVLKLVLNPFAPADAGYVKDFFKQGYGDKNIVGKYKNVYDLIIDTDGTIYIADGGWNKVIAYDNAGNYKFEFGSAGSGDGQFNAPQGMTIVGGEIYVTDWGNDRVQIFDKKTGKFISKFGQTGTGGNGDLNNPTSIVAGTDGRVYIVDNLNYRIKQFKGPCARFTVKKTVTPNRSRDVFDFVSNKVNQFSLSDGGSAPKSTTFDIVSLDKPTNYISEKSYVGYNTNVTCTVSKNLKSDEHLTPKDGNVSFYLGQGEKVECNFVNDCKSIDGKACSTSIIQ